jgi:predicted unusual protein kinase regulating ubiquinone biosynthesis (AarF/ABC1/UbiB family)
MQNMSIGGQVTVARATICASCGGAMKPGERAQLLDARRLRCGSCAAALPPVASAIALAAPSALHAGDATLLVAGALVAGTLVVRSRTVRRLARTLGVALRSAARLARDRVRGRKGTGPVVVRRAFEELGPTYVKLGQLVASTQGILPERYEGYGVELRACLDRVSPLPFPAIERVVREELGRPLASVFSEIDKTPLASASIAQVHAARLRDGAEVVLKVQRPGIAASIAADVKILRVLARALASTARGAMANPVAIVDDFGRTLEEELDFVREAASMEEFRRILAEHDQSEVVAPRVVSALTSRRLLVMERFFGSRVDDLDAHRAAGLDAADLEAKLLVGMRAWFQGVVFHGFFHGDVHAGNLMALRDGRIGFLDFGVVGRLDPAQRRGVIDTLMCFATGDFRRLAETWRAMGSCGGETDLDALGRDLRAIYEPLLASSVEAITYADLLPGILRAAERHGLRMPRDFVLVTKQMLYFDRYAKKLAPKLNVFRDARLVTPLAFDVAMAGWAMG